MARESTRLGWLSPSARGQPRVGAGLPVAGLPGFQGADGQLGPGKLWGSFSLHPDRPFPARQHRCQRRGTSPGRWMRRQQ